MKDKFLKIAQATWTAIKTTFFIWTEKQIVKFMEKRGYICTKK